MNCSPPFSASIIGGPFQCIYVNMVYIYIYTYMYMYMYMYVYVYVYVYIYIYTYIYIYATSYEQVGGSFGVPSL